MDSPDAGPAVPAAIEEDEVLEIDEVAATVVLPAHMLASFRPTSIRKKEEEERRRKMAEESSENGANGGGRGFPGRKVRKILLPCLKSPTFDDLNEEDSSERLDLVDEKLGTAHRGVMAKTGQKYLAMEASSFPDRVFTGTLIVLTMLGILVLFW